MKFDVTIFPTDLNAAADIARQVEAHGFDGLWTSETAHNPFLPLTHAAAVTKRINLGTAVAIAFPRSPMVTAQIAWDLAEQSSGRIHFRSGHTSQNSHCPPLQHRMGSARSPFARVHESIRAIWASFQSSASLKYLWRTLQIFPSHTIFLTRRDQRPRNPNLHCGRE